MPSTTESITSTIVSTSRLPTGDARIDGLPPNSTDSRTYGFGLGNLGSPKETKEALLPPVIPPPHPTRKRTLVVCFDGTGDQFDNDNSNIVKLVALMKKDDRHQQLVYYQVSVLQAS
jgi:hypothetical protein